MSIVDALKVFAILYTIIAVLVFAVMYGHSKSVSTAFIYACFWPNILLEGDNGSPSAE